MSINVLLSNLIGVYADVVSNYRSQILASYDTDVVACQYLLNPTSSNWSCKDDLLLYKGLIYILEILYIEVLSEHHNVPLAGHCSTTRTLELVTWNY
jgi:hypothetical protein